VPLSVRERYNARIFSGRFVIDPVRSASIAPARLRVRFAVWIVADVCVSVDHFA
jgi:hypothetical protein